MVRSMYSGVSGMRTHQTAMDTIGNNIANVNTYGFKGSRTTFADIYYQSLRGASAASASRGGVNASQVGVGSQVRSVDLMMTRSSFTQTDMTMDVAVDGEGFLQVMDPDGNKYYTRAGQLLFDANGNLVDSKGNFVLGTNGDPFGKDPGSDKIQVSLGSVNPAASKKTEEINGIKWTVSTTNPTEDGNVGVSFISDSTMAENADCIAEVTDSGIVVRINGKMKFTEATFSEAVNAAIQKASQNKIQANHPAGNFTITAEGLNWGTDGLTGEELCSTNKNVVEGSITGVTKMNGYGFESFGSDFGRTTASAGVTTPSGAGGASDGSLIPTFNAGKLTYTLTLNGVAYSAELSSIPQGASKVILYQGGTKSNDYVEVSIPDISKYFLADGSGFASHPDPANPANDIPYTINDVPQVAAADMGTAFTVTASKVPTAMGLSSKTFSLEGGTKGGQQGIETLTGVSIGTDGTITGFHSIMGEVKIGRIDLANFVNPSGLQANGGTYFATTPNSGTMKVCKPGQDGTGQVVAGSLELSNVDLSREFTDMIKTQRGYQANSRIITVSDTMLEELVNLKR